MEWIFIAAVIGTLVSAGINAYSTHKTNETNRELARQANQFNAEQAQINRDFQTKSIDNSVAAALRSGLNPDIFASGSVPTYSGDSATANLAQMQPFKMPDLGSSIISGVQAMQEAKNAEKQRELMDSEIFKNETQSHLNKTQAELNQSLKNYQDVLTVNVEANTRLTNAQYNYTVKQLEECGARINRINHEIELLKAQKSWTEEQTLLTGKQVDAFCEELQKKLDLWDSQIRLNKSGALLNGAQIGLVKAEKELAIANKGYVEENTKALKIANFNACLKIYADFGLIPDGYSLTPIDQNTVKLSHYYSLKEAALSGLEINNDQLKFNYDLNLENRGWKSFGIKMQSMRGVGDAALTGLELISLFAK